MSPDGPSEMDQLDALTIELGEAGRIARVATDQRGRPDPVFTMRLRAELLASFGSIPIFAPGDAQRPSLVEPMPRPLELGASDVELELRADEAFGSISSPFESERPAAEKRWRDRSADRRSNSNSPLPEILRGAEPTTPSRRTRGTPAASPRSSTHLFTGTSRTGLCPRAGSAVGLAACLALAAFLVGSGTLFPVKSPARTDDAVAATLVRGHDSTALVAGSELSQGDEIRVAAGGRAYLALGSSYVRLDGGADVRLDSLDSANLEIAQLAGRVYHRVVLPDGGRYRVTTGDVTWQATGTAFDIDRETTAGSDRVLGMALQHDVQVIAPSFDASVTQGSSASFVLSSTGSTVGSPVTTAIPAALLASAWLVENAQIDARLGLPLGELANAVLESPTPTAPATPAPTPTPDLADTRARGHAGGHARDDPSPDAHRGPDSCEDRHSQADGDADEDPQARRSQPGQPFDRRPTRTVLTPSAGPGTAAPGSSSTSWFTVPWGTQPTFNGSNYWACPSNVADTSWTGGVPAGDFAVRIQVIDESTGKIVVRAQTAVVRLTVPVARDC